MGDPLSAVGSVIAIFGLTLQSCEVAYRFFRSFHEANDEHLALDCKARLNGCLLNLKGIEEVINARHSGLQRGKVSKTWNQVRWAGTYQKQRVEIYMSRIQSYYISFTQDLMIINT